MLTDEHRKIAENNARLNAILALIGYVEEDNTSFDPSKFDQAKQNLEDNYATNSQRLIQIMGK